MIQNAIVVNIGLGVFNLIPLPPLDGSKVLAAVLPQDLYMKYMSIEQYGFIILIVILVLVLLVGGCTAGCVILKELKEN